MIEQSFREDIFQILRLLSLSKDHSTQRDLSNQLNISLGKTNYLLKSLIEKGFVEIKNFSEGNQKLKKVRYHLTTKGLKFKIKLAYYFLKIKEKEYFKLKKEVFDLRS